VLSKRRLVGIVPRAGSKRNERGSRVDESRSSLNPSRINRRKLIAAVKDTGYKAAVSNSAQE